MLTAIATSVIGALCLAAILAAIRSRWLYVVAPRLFLNTPLSDGQIVSLAITNAGLLAEEDVALTLRPGCKFELIATSKSTLAVSGKTLSLPKLARGESVTVLLLFEGKSFDHSDIDSIDSKATKGKVVDSKENATALWHNFIVFPVVLLLLVLPFALGTYIGSVTKMSAVEYLNDKLDMFGQSKQLAGYRNEIAEQYRLTAGELAGATKDGRIAIEVQEVVRRGDVLTILLKLTNNTPKVVMAEVVLKGTSGDDGPLNWKDSRSERLAIASKASRSLKLKVYVPDQETVKLVEGTYTFRIPGSTELSVSQLLTF
jgi:hypothetical protein